MKTTNRTIKCETDEQTSAIRTDFFSLLGILKKEALPQKWKSFFRFKQEELFYFCNDCKLRF